jgi:hypothetical protein
MAYKILVTGIVCFIEEQDGYLVAIPDGRSAPDPTDPSKPLPEHNAFLFIRLSDIFGLENWSGDAENGVIALPIDPGSTLNFDSAELRGALDDTQFLETIYNWQQLDPGFRADPVNPKNTLSTFRLQRGIMHAYRIPGGEALVIESEIEQKMKLQPLFDIFLTAGNVTRRVTVIPDAEVVVANISDHRRIGGEVAEAARLQGNDDNHIYIYYQLDESGNKPAIVLPLPVLPVGFSRSQHPFIKGQRDLHVHCSPTLQSSTGRTP